MMIGKWNMLTKTDSQNLNVMEISTVTLDSKYINSNVDKSFHFKEHWISLLQKIHLSLS